MNPAVRLLSDKFFDEGYATAHFGKWHCLRRHTDCRFTEFEFIEESVPIWPQSDIKRLYRSDDDPVFLEYGPLVHAATHPCAADATGPAEITDLGLRFLENHASGPFMLRVSYLGPHAPVLVPKPFDTMYNPDDMEIPDFSIDEFANRPEAVRRVQEHCIQTRGDTPDGMTPEQAVRAHIAYNLGSISHIDDQIGRILSKVQNLGIENETVVIFTSDHGGFWGEHGLLEKSVSTLYRNLLQLPLVMSGPGILPEGVTREGIVEGLDLYPTMLDLAGMENPYRINGISFKDMLLAGGEGRRDAFAEILHAGQYVASLRDEKWNFIWHAASDEAELYDVSSDFHERFNLAHDPAHADTIHLMTRRLLGRIMNNRNVEIIPDDDKLNRSPIWLTPGRDAAGHEQALINMFRRHADVFADNSTSDEFPVEKK